MNPGHIGFIEGFWRTWNSGGPYGTNYPGVQAAIATSKATNVADAAGIQVYGAGDLLIGQ